ncbi:uncharacterized protein LOC124928904 [Impatiens glandulifera]|uniref:uncharacterized protein LOC124928904 n=1 Tax=Impatiens glandulifera TaxID=253017 RepID=UPI001FB12110|nr:uncharacterized protein LOC124928904 [Impatiens glandulifera]
MELQNSSSSKIQIYSTSSSGISQFWIDKYERDAKKYWDIFYKHHQDKFFKDRHYLDKEWGDYFPGDGQRVILEVGCGAGNTIFPLIATYPDIFIHACDFSTRAVNLVKAHKDFSEARVNAFVCDLTADDLSQNIPPSSVDVVTMIFVLSAVSPEKMPLAIKNISKVLKPGGCLLFRDYATGDLAQERFICKDQKLSENFYVRGDGTRAFYFSEEFLANLFEENGFDMKESNICCKQVENRSREIVMNRRWIQAAFRLRGANTRLEVDAAIGDETVIDMSEGVAADMFGISNSNDEIIEVNLKESRFKIKVLPKEFQHTCKSTGLMLWESARLMASILERNPSICEGKRVLELGCGCAGICSMVAVKSANLVVATDGDEKAISLLTDNIELNLNDESINKKLMIKRLEWGNSDQLQALKLVLNEDTRGFDVILGTDVTYVAEAISPLFSTAKELLISGGDGRSSALILCHVLRRVDQQSILLTASRFGFRLVDDWQSGVESCAGSDGRRRSIIRSWFGEIDDDDDAEDFIPSKALHIMYFERVAS